MCLLAVAGHVPRSTGEQCLRGRAGAFLGCHCLPSTSLCQVWRCPRWPWVTSRRSPAGGENMLLAGTTTLSGPVPERRSDLGRSALRTLEWTAGLLGARGWRTSSCRLFWSSLGGGGGRGRGNILQDRNVIEEHSWAGSAHVRRLTWEAGVRRRSPRAK